LIGYERWNRKAAELSSLASFKTSNLLERKSTGTEKKQGLDIADYLVKLDPREFIKIKEGAFLFYVRV
jgi:hypothetical protein